MYKDNFRTEIATSIFKSKYALNSNQTWWEKCRDIVKDVVGGKMPLMSKSEQDELTKMIYNMEFIPGGRYVYYGGREARYYNNCFAFKSEADTKEAWADLVHDVMLALTSGGGVGNDYSVFRPKGRLLSRTGGTASGPIPLMQTLNELGRNVMQGGSRRSALYASLNWQHEDIPDFLEIKNWSEAIRVAKNTDFNFPAPLDMTNISVNYDDDWLNKEGLHPVYLRNVEQALKTGEPGFSFNFGENANETARNACSEFTSDDNGDVCNLGSINLSRIETVQRLREVVDLASKFLVAGTIRGEVPLERARKVREKNRKIGLGIMGVHEWLLKRGYSYGMNDELENWLANWARQSEVSANEHCDRFYINRPKKYRAIAPTGTIGILAGTTTGIEPLFAVAYKRRYLTGGTNWNYEYVIDGTAKILIDMGIDPVNIESAIDLAADPERRIRFQYDVQKYVDMAISSTINLPEWGSDLNNEDTVKPFAEMLKKYAHGLRGFTCYPDGSRGGQPLVSVPYEEAKDRTGNVYKEHDVCDITGKGGSCGV